MDEIPSVQTFCISVDEAAKQTVITRTTAAPQQIELMIMIRFVSLSNGSLQKSSSGIWVMLLSCKRSGVWQNIFNLSMKTLGLSSNQAFIQLLSHEHFHGL
jgi:hypothetical protein